MTFRQLTKNKNKTCVSTLQSTTANTVATLPKPAIMSTTVDTTTQGFKGPGKTNPGGTWYVKDHTAVSRDCGSIFCAVCVCDCSVCCIMCCPLKKEYIYEDPKTKKLIGEDGSIHPSTERKFLKELKADDVETLRVKFGPPATMQRE
jgi:hypothetical protein